MSTIPPNPAHPSRLPVIAVTGHLGAGKTTLLNHLLRAPGARLGVVVNDFGVVNVDAGLVAAQVDDVAGIAGGCVCCLPDAGGLDGALERLSHPRLRLDAIIVEASGVAEPLALAKLIRYSGVQRVRLGGVVDVIDAVEHFRTVDLWPEPPVRHAAATLVVVSKLDGVAAAERESQAARIVERVRMRNPHAPVVVADHGRVDPTLIFDVATPDDPEELPIAALLRESDGEHLDHAHARSASVALPAPISPTALVDLLESPPADAYRMKGRVRVRAVRGERGYAVNVVGSMIHVAPLPVVPQVGELVAIGIDMSAHAATTRLAAVAAAPADRPDVAGLRRLHRYRRLSD
ncbi:GTP-binding protein [Microbacterium sediminicola]|uniref:CobW family GTP-binding protein n=1 Tax=Microbacterium sediminicola TaxID=415210 RepID=UPI0031DAFE07